MRQKLFQISSEFIKMSRLSLSSCFPHGAESHLMMSLALKAPAIRGAEDSLTALGGKQAGKGKAGFYEQTHLEM